MFSYKIRRRKSQKRDFNVVFIQFSWIGIILKFLCDKKNVQVYRTIHSLLME